MPKAGPYFLYMVDFKKEKEKELGRNVSMAEVSQMASDSWNSMSDEDKAYYKAKAKGGEVRIPKRPGISTGGAGDSGGNRLTSHGVPVEIYEREQRQLKSEEENMRRRIGAMIQSISLTNEFLKHPLYLMYGNFFYHDKKIDEYAPAELAMVKYTFQDGILKRFHTYISPDKIAFGYAFSAKEHSEASHRLPRPPDAYGQKNFGRVLYEIEKFMDNDDKAFDGGKPMVFTFTDTYASEANQIDVLKSFMKQFALDKPNPVDLYPLTRLFYALRKELAARGRVDDVPNERFCDNFLSNDPYETHGGISCEYHEGIDATRHCALSRVHRWSFLLSDHFCEPLGVQLKPGTHLPENAALPQSLLSIKSGSDDEISDKKEKERADSDYEPLHGRFSRISSDTKSQDDSLDHKISRDIRRSDSTLNCEIQSIRTSSTASDAVSATDRRKHRPTRSLLVESTINSQPNSSTFYNA